MINTSNKFATNFGKVPLQRHKFLMAIFIIAIFSIFSLQALGAEENKKIETGLDATAKTAGFETNTVKEPAEIVAKIVKVALGFVGTLFLILIIFSGFQWMTAGGNSDTITKARQRMINATIGLVIILGAYAITTFIIFKLVFL